MNVKSLRQSVIGGGAARPPAKIAMLLSNPYNPDDRVRNEARALCRAGYEVIILAWDRELSHPKHEKIDGMEIIRIRLQSRYERGLKQTLVFARIWGLFFQQLRAIKPNVVHCHDFDTYLAGLCYCGQNRNVRLVLDAHENYSLMIKVFVSKATGFAVAAMESLFTRFADVVVAPCDATLDHYRSLGARKTVVVGNWKAPDAYVYSPDVLREKRDELGIGARLVVTYIGALSSERHVLPLIEAIAERPRIFLILGGSGSQETQIRARIGELANVYFPGYIHPDSVPLFTALSDVIYYGYQVDHPYGPFNAPNKLFEALAAGKVLLASDLGGELSRVVNSVHCGILLSQLTSQSIGDALDRLLDDEYRFPMQMRALQAGRQLYNQHVALQRLLTTYSELLLCVQ